jgi:hypothetical protein
MRLEMRLGITGLRMAEEKVRVFELGRTAAKNIQSQRDKSGPKRPESFDFLGFQFYLGEEKGSGRFRPKVRPVSKPVKEAGLID